ERLRQHHAALPAAGPQLRLLPHSPPHGGRSVQREVVYGTEVGEHRRVVLPPRAAAHSRREPSAGLSSTLSIWSLGPQAWSPSCLATPSRVFQCRFAGRR